MTAAEMSMSLTSALVVVTVALVARDISRRLCRRRRPRPAPAPYDWKVDGDCTYRQPTHVHRRVS